MPEKIHIPRELGDFLGNEQDEAYANAFGAEITDGFQDGGKDLRMNDPEVPEIQVKSSKEGVKHFLIKSIEKEEFIPICVGEPGTKKEMLESIQKFGAWVGRDIPGREEFLGNIAKVRDLCHSKEGVLKKLLAELG
ncbi:MAG: hypothetical protein AAB900_00895 [Patescibacteria group bacterium]